MRARNSVHLQVGKRGRLLLNGTKHSRIGLVHCFSRTAARPANHRLNSRNHGTRLRIRRGDIRSQYVNVLLLVMSLHCGYSRNADSTADVAHQAVEAGRVPHGFARHLAHGDSAQRHKYQGKRKSLNELRPEEVR